MGNAQTQIAFRFFETRECHFDRMHLLTALSQAHRSSSLAIVAAPSLAASAVEIARDLDSDGATETPRLHYDGKNDVGSSCLIEIGGDFGERLAHEQPLLLCIATWILSFFFGRRSPTHYLDFQHLFLPFSRKLDLVSRTMMRHSDAKSHRKLQRVVREFLKANVHRVSAFRQIRSFLVDVLVILTSTALVLGWTVSRVYQA